MNFLLDHKIIIILLCLIILFIVNEITHSGEHAGSPLPSHLGVHPDNYDSRCTNYTVGADLRVCPDLGWEKDFSRASFLAHVLWARKERENNLYL